MSPSKVDDISDPAPLEPALSWLIVESYEGSEDDLGRFDGDSCIAKFKEGHTYEGSFSRGMMHGQGKYIWTDGTVFEGEFKWNVIDGYGSFLWSDGTTYTGMIKNGLRDGEGKFTGPNNTPAYTGMWKKGKRHGRGTLWYDADKDCYYEGDWVNNRRHGQGNMRWKPSKSLLNLSGLQGAPRKKRSSHSSEGNYYSGMWDNDLKSGMGTMEWFDRGERYSGMWCNGKQNGRGEHVWIETAPDGTSMGTQKQMSNRYVGDWLQGERHGEGVFTYASGARYEGLWAHNCKEGFGVLTFEDGHVYAGAFLADRLVEPDMESPLKGKDETMQPQLRLHVDDLFPSQIDKVTGRLRLERTVLRYTSELKVVYKWYCGLKHGAYPPSAGIFAMSMLQFKQLWMDCSLGSYGVSFVMVHRLAAAMRAQHVSEVNALTCSRRDNLTMQADVGTDKLEGKEPFAPDTPLLFREFVELLARIAVVAFSNVNVLRPSRPVTSATYTTPSTPKNLAPSPKSPLPPTPKVAPPSTTNSSSKAAIQANSSGFMQPADAFSQLMTQAISGKHGQPFVKGSFVGSLRDSDTDAMFNLYNDKLHKLFDAWASPSSGLLALRNFIQMLKACGVSTSKESGGLGLSEDEVIRELVIGDAEFPLEYDPTLLDREFMFVDFLDALAQLAHTHHPADLPAMVDHGDHDNDDAEADDKVAAIVPKVGAHGVQQSLCNHVEALINKLNIKDACRGPKPKSKKYPSRLPINITIQPETAVHSAQ